MVFWKLQSPKYDSSTPFSPSLYKKDALPSPTGVNAVLITAQMATTSRLFTEICVYLKNYFGEPPKTPVLDIPEDKLLGPHDYLFLVRDQNSRIAGTIRYRYTGKLLVKDQPEIWRVDCFCIHPEWRKKGVGDYLLTELQCYATKHGEPYAMFLKEGPSLSILNIPMYSSAYVYRPIKANMILAHNVRILSSLQAFYHLEWYSTICPDVMIIRNEHGKNQHWRYYKNDYATILACFQDTYQRFHGTGEKIGWCTCWLESPLMTDEIRKEAAIEITHTLPAFDYIWMDKRWVGKGQEWKHDGGFHWYPYQWTSNLTMEQSYCIMD